MEQRAKQAKALDGAGGKRANLASSARPNPKRSPKVSMAAGSEFIGEMVQAAKNRRFCRPVSRG